MLLKESLTFVPGHPNQGCSLANVHLQSKLFKLCKKERHLAQSIKKLLAGVKDLAPNEVIRINLQIIKGDEGFKMLRNIACVTCPNKW